MNPIVVWAMNFMVLESPAQKPSPSIRQYWDYLHSFGIRPSQGWSLYLSQFCSQWSPNLKTRPLRPNRYQIQLCHCNLLHEVMEGESAVACFHLHSVFFSHGVGLHILYWKQCSVYVAINQFKYLLCSCTTENIACRHTTKDSASSRAISASQPHPCAIFPIVHSLLYLNNYMSAVYKSTERQLLQCLSECLSFILPSL